MQRPDTWPEYMGDLWPTGEQIAALLRSAGHSRVEFGWHTAGDPDRSTREFAVTVDGHVRSLRASRRMTSDGEGSFEVAEEGLVRDVLAQVEAYVSSRKPSA